MDEKTGKTWGSVWIGGLLPEDIVDDAEFRRRDAFRCPVRHRVMGWLREWEAGRCERRESGPTRRLLSRTCFLGFTRETLTQSFWILDRCKKRTQCLVHSTNKSFQNFD